MKVIFAGPSLPDAASLAGEGIRVLPPATQGDVLAVVEQGANVIGLIDGGFEYAAPVWHKEILHALSLGVTVLGAASMGALRAAECHSFGMIGIGRIFEDYRTGRLVDDAAVALVHAPSALGGKPLTIPLVNVCATLDAMERNDLLPDQLRQVIEDAASAIFFKRRTWRAIVEQCAGVAEPDRPHLLATLVSHSVDQKRIDALELLKVVQSTADIRVNADLCWKLRETWFSTRSAL
ncbi:MULTISPECIES: TfuA-like protein [Rhizobium]|uniref:TfuA-like protein n=1 Tax=Rhizobium TaxID=379 RepID=UPI0007EBB7B1|nr:MULTISPECIES: TfuA-like protein [Rhizobium]ANK92797.1 TfuA-like domain-containing protein [Rhizobium sp. N6212]ANK98844.1 TfuA-like domain-containing protein [Rhizobium sp. N621]ANL04972.1 TfuA-like domain-containing protein [Rhizobium esperanzae]ANL11029.1 TfuA-like domain-containing protein [Rhizobium sp. N1341]ANL23081.1 TfuA-like domain-containing protein [Rhizobium sp. N113]